MINRKLINKFDHHEKKWDQILGFLWIYLGFEGITFEDPLSQYIMFILMTYNFQ